MSKLFTLKNTIIVVIVAISITAIWLFVAINLPEKEEYPTSNTSEISLADKLSFNKNNEMVNTND